ncbi:hydrolase [Halalkalibacter wakoensis JCM 9140]|uniref:Hydrolase n=1 Tax=Halalkalibacter wakoensis JCM 9140 TaxID=1236970 RepID=W4Q2E0_9BACI|nr:fumarylacetoacetate hydrolase family protein [Halalkalibacter wakoensis]GAE26105.1 hydrolase [Halalkalibacter wakoensis JCM 9140]
MKLASIKQENKEVAGILTEKGIVLLETVNKQVETEWPLTVFEILETGLLPQLTEWYDSGGLSNIRDDSFIPEVHVTYAPLYRTPRKIWGIGMNYVSVRSELGGLEESDPVFFMKPDTSLIGEQDTIEIPPQSKKTTAEAELAVIIAKTCKNVSEEEVDDVIAGYTTSIDVTAADIHAENPRFIQRAKSFDTFFSFGSVLLTKDEVPNLSSLEVTTKVNGEIHHQNKVKNMICSPRYIVSFLSKVTTLLPGDVIMTGTPGASVIRDGDVVEARISGFPSLTNGVS